jgi:P-type Ca2+ transporter type 2C
LVAATIVSLITGYI